MPRARECLASAPLAPAGRLPLRFGSPHPSVMVLHEDGVYRIRTLVVDEDDARASRDRALASGEPWMPEHHYPLGKPIGPIHAEAAIDELVEALRDAQRLAAVEVSSVCPAQGVAGQPSQSIEADLISAQLRDLAADGTGCSGDGVLACGDAGLSVLRRLLLLGVVELRPADRARSAPAAR